MNWLQPHFTGLLRGFCLGLSDIPKEHCVITIMEMQLAYHGQPKRTGHLGSGLRNCICFILWFHLNTLYTAFSLLGYTQGWERNVNLGVLHSLSDRQCHQVCDCLAPKWPVLPSIDPSFHLLITSLAPQHFRPEDSGGSVLAKAYSFALQYIYIFCIS